MTSILEQVLSIAEQRHDASVRELIELLRIKSISTDPKYAPDVLRCADWWKGRLERLGFTVQLISVPDTESDTQADTQADTGSGPKATKVHHPIVYATYSRPSTSGKPRKRVLVYGHYDVQPAELDGRWLTEPFEPTIKGDDIFARGAVDDKGQLATYLSALEACNAAGLDYPVDLTFLIEGQEECGSKGLKALLAAPPPDLDLSGDLVMVSDTSMAGPCQPALTYTLRGNLAMEIFLTGPADEVHSGTFGGGIRNPLAAAAWIISQVQNPVTGRFTFPHMLEGLLPVTTSQRQLMDEFPVDSTEFLADAQASATWEQDGVPLDEAISHRPTFEVNGIIGGYTGTGAKTIIPPGASFKVTCRLGPGQDPQQIGDALEAYILEVAAPLKGIQCKVQRSHGGRAFVLDVDDPAVPLARQALEAAFSAPCQMQRAGGSIPITTLLQDGLKAPVILMGFGLESNRLHGPNEHFSLTHLRLGTQAVIRYWFALAELAEAA